MPATRLKIFVSSVQKELAKDRRALKSFIEADPLLQRFFTVFLFEDLSARDRRADAVYLEQVDRCDLYLGLFGNDYGSEAIEGLSPTEREFDQATVQGKPRLIFVKGTTDEQRQPKLRALLRKADGQLIRRRYNNIAELKMALYASLVDQLEANGILQARPFDERPTVAATLADLASRKVKDFVHIARSGRQFPLSDKTPLAEVLTHLHMLYEGQPTNAALLLFGRDPQHFFPCAEIRCMHFHGTEIQRPVPFYRIFKGTIFEQVDLAVDFVMSKIDRSIGTRALSAQAPVHYEIPPDVIREAIVNAIAHRDYTSAGAVQVSVFSDRVEIWNPGVLQAPLTMESLRHPHGSIARNHRICEALFLAQYIEKYGTGTLMMIRESLAHNLPEPDFAQRGGEFTATIWRDWFTAKTISQLELSARQKQAIFLVKIQKRLSNLDYQKAYGVSKPTASRDLEHMVKNGVLEKVGTTGKGTYYTLASKGLTKGSKGSSSTQDQKGSQRAQRAKATNGKSVHKKTKSRSQPRGK